MTAFMSNGATASPVGTVAIPAGGVVAGDPLVLALAAGLSVYNVEAAENYVLDPGGGIETLVDLNGDNNVDINSVRGTDDSRKAGVSGGVIQVRTSGNKTFEAFEPDEGAAGKGAFIVVANMMGTGSHTLFAWGPSNDRPRFNYQPETGGYSFSWGGGGSQSHSGSGGPLTQNRKAVYAFYVPPGTATPKFWVDGAAQTMGTNEGTFPAKFHDATMFGKDDVNESTGMDIDVSELYMALTGAGEAAEGLSEGDFLAIAQGLAAKHGVAWLA